MWCISGVEGIGLGGVVYRYPINQTDRLIIGRLSKQNSRIPKFLFTSVFPIRCRVKHTGHGSHVTLCCMTYSASRKPDGSGDLFAIFWRLYGDTVAAF